MIITLRLRRNTYARWLLLNPILDEGEQGYEINTGKHKIGDGVSRWTDLPYFIPESEVRAAIEAAVADVAPDSPVGQMVLSEHVASETPHPVYDDGPSLLLLYQNAKV